MLIAVAATMAGEFILIGRATEKFDLAAYQLGSVYFYGTQGVGKDVERRAKGRRPFLGAGAGRLGPILFPEGVRVST